MICRHYILALFALVTGVAPRAGAQSLSLGLRACDDTQVADKTKASWIQQGDCAVPKPIVYWPLFSFSSAEHHNPVSMPLVRCLTGNCGLDLKPWAWWLGPVNAGDPTLQPQQALAINLSWKAEESRQPVDVINDFLQHLADQTKLVEIAWRFGQVDAAPSILKLTQIKNDRALIGDCSQLNVGIMQIDGAKWKLISTCNTSSGSDSQDAVFRMLFLQSSSLRWSVETLGQALPKLSNAQNITFSLFPYEMTTCDELAGNSGFSKRNSFPHPTPSASARFLATVDLAMQITSATSAKISPPAGERKPAWIIAIILVGMAMLVGGARLIQPMLAKRYAKVAWLSKSPFLGPAQPNTVSPEAAPPCADETPKQALQTQDQAPQASPAVVESSNPPADTDHSAAGFAKLQALIQQLAVRIDKVESRVGEAPKQTPQTQDQAPQAVPANVEPSKPAADADHLPALIPQLTQRVYKLETLITELQADQRAMQDAALTSRPEDGKKRSKLDRVQNFNENQSFLNRIIATEKEIGDIKGRLPLLDSESLKKTNATAKQLDDWSRKVVSQEKSVASLETSVRSHSECIARHDTLIKKQADLLNTHTEWYQRLDDAVPKLIADHWQKLRHQRLQIDESENQSGDSTSLPETPPELDPKAVPLLQALLDMSEFGGSILNVWLRDSTSPGKNLGDDPLGATAFSDLRSLESVAYGDRLLWSWWLRRSPSPASDPARFALQKAKRKWLPASPTQPITQDDLARIALQWADDRLPHLQTLIEATPFDWGPSDDPMEIHEPLKLAARDLGATPDLAASIAALSTTFHKLASDLYRCANAQYVSTRLYSDRIQTGDVAAFISATKAAYAFKHSDLLIQRHVATAHGVIVRITQPISKRRDSVTGQSRWEGSLYYLEALNK